MSHLSVEQMTGYARRGLDAETLLLADDHLSSCDECRGRLIDDEGLRATVASLRADLRAALEAPTGHLPYDQIEARAEGRLRGAAREIAETHLEHCTPCARQARDLEAFAAAFRDARPRGGATAASDTAASGGVPVGSAETGEDRETALPLALESSAATPRPTAPARSQATAPVAALEAESPALSLPEAPRSRLLPVVAVLVTIAVLAGGLAGARALRRRLSGLTTQVEELTRRNETLAAQAAQIESLRSELQNRAAAAAVPAAPARIAMTLQDKRGPVGLDDEGNLVGLDALPVGDGRAIEAALRRGSLEAPDEVRALSAAPGGEAGGGAAMTLLTGAGTLVRNTRPTLSWEAVEGARLYTLVLLDEAGQPLFHGGPMSATSWTPPRALRRGATYAWRVAASRPGEVPPAAGETTGAAAPPEAETLGSGAARFKVIDSAASAAIERGLRAAPGSRLVAGVLYARAGLLDDAGRELKALAEANPDSGVARGLLASIETARLP